MQEKHFNYKHGRSRDKIYCTWRAMVNRCTNKKNPLFHLYGGRGITVCEDWKQFVVFLRDMGEIPFANAQIDRIDNNKGYCKENCKWSTPSENSRNKRNSKFIETHLGRLNQSELIEKIGWNKTQFRWFKKKYGIEWILENFKNGTIPPRTNEEIDRQDIVGKNFGKWIVVGFDSYTKPKGHLYLCRCQCGVERLIPRNNLIKEKTTQCRSCAALSQWSRQSTSS